MRIGTTESSHLSSFHDFGLAEPLTRALAEEKYVTPTPIQTHEIVAYTAGRMKKNRIKTLAGDGNVPIRSEKTDLSAQG